MSIKEALENTLKFLEAVGYQDGDVYDDLKLAILRLKAMKSELGEYER